MRKESEQLLIRLAKLTIISLHGKHWIIIVSLPTAREREKKNNTCYVCMSCMYRLRGYELGGFELGGYELKGYDIECNYVESYVEEVKRNEIIEPVKNESVQC